MRKFMVGPRHDKLVGDYIALLRLIRAKHVSFDEAAIQDNEKKVVIRHDVDHDLDKAIAIAELENKEGFFSTFFLLPTAEYFDYTKDFTRAIQYLRSLNHYVGLHNNALTQHIRDDIPLKDCIIKPLHFLRVATDSVNWTAAHGDKFLKEKDLINYQMWKECPEPWDGQTLSLRRYFLDEVYFVPREAYLSDTGGRWLGGPKKGVVWESDLDPCSPIDVILYFNKMPQGTFHLLIHPFWWE